ncbi:signal peptidase I [Humibacter sp.]|uniref:signal peptidase I n=1 Tax=Humibacter sp. TaxID=1940291 RepID=UPI002C07C952|nr:signal peptidase I [Humibacter sp.]HVX07605.1 signal peptidase I [Humibacter sp.]
MTDQLETVVRDRLHAALLPADGPDWAGGAIARAGKIERRRLLLAVAGAVVVLGGVAGGLYAGVTTHPTGGPTPAASVGPLPAGEQQAIDAALASAPPGSRVETVPSASMAATLEVGDVVLVVPTTTVQRGDIVAFDGSQAGNHWPNVNTRTLTDPTAKNDFIKRVIAVGGDTIGCPPTSATSPNECSGVVVNGQPVDERAYTYGTAPDGVTPSRVPDPTYTFSTTTVPPGQLFVMGDQRDRSNDSRFNGTINTAAVRGVVTAIVWPLERARAITTPTS